MPNAYVRFIDDAVDDLRVLHRKDPQIVRAVLKKCLLLEHDPQAGEPLLGRLVGFRKLVVGNRDWRIVWRVTTDGDGNSLIDIAEVWAAGARADAVVYDTITARIDHVEDATLRHALTKVVTLLASGSAIAGATEPVSDPVPTWLRDRLIHTANMPPEFVDGLTGEQAMQEWETFLTR